MDASYAKQFVATIDSIGRSRGRYDRFSDFLELAYCAIAKRTLAPGPDADVLEECKFRGNPPPDSEMMPPPNSEN